MTGYKYDKSARRKIRARIKVLHKEGVKNYEAMAAILNKEGFLSPRGEALKASTVQSQALQAGIRKHRVKRAPARKAQAPMEQTVLDDSTILADLILDAKISDSKKITLLRNLRTRG
jgi:hypothetical protein